MVKKIGIMTTGGDCSGLNTAIGRIAIGGIRRGWEVFGIRDGTDGLSFDTSKIIKFNMETLPIELARLSGSVLGNGRAGMENFETAAKSGKHSWFNKKLKRALDSLKLDALILIGGNGSLSLAYKHSEIYSGLQLVCIPKTIDMDIPMTDRTIGFDTAVQQLVNFCDQLLLTARSHHRWFVVQAMGRDNGNLALNAGVALGADAILIPEIKFDIDSLIDHINNTPRDYGIIMVSEGISLRGHSGKPADMISRKLTAAGITNRAAFPEHTQRAGDTLATDRILAARFADCALDAIENNETYVMTAMQNGIVKTIPLSEFFDAGEQVRDPKIPDMIVSNSYVDPDDPLLEIAEKLGIYIGECK
ncbi:ATP-dependent 6-phosphofructokinase [Lachnospiraceae bacterium OttesenSCG-928-E19]|nr:ATP-dependent 6-phosphofructokinase [Lachnospiraceae bacterium OttesenSCG-928-E19]